MAYLGNCKVGDKLIVAHRNKAVTDVRKEVVKVGRKYVTTGDDTRFDKETGEKIEHNVTHSWWFAFTKPEELTRFRERVELEYKAHDQIRRFVRFTPEHTDDEIRAIIRTLVK